MPELSTPLTRARVTGALLVAAFGLAVLAGCAGSEPPVVATPTDSDVGTAFTSDDGLEVTLTSRICGISGVGADKPEFTPVGQYCTIGVAVENGTDDEVDLTQLKISGYIGETQYFPDYWAGNAADGGMQKLGAGDSVDSTLFLDVPKGQVLDRAEITSPWAGVEKFEVKF